MGWMGRGRSQEECIFGFEGSRAVPVSPSGFKFNFMALGGLSLSLNCFQI
jgi:hypothetical protein